MTTEREKEIRERVKRAVDAPHGYRQMHSHALGDLEWCLETIAALKAEIEAAEKRGTKHGLEDAIHIIQGGSFLTADSPERKWANAVEKLIRKEIEKL
ncbi:hypothetical protein [Glutamicibacter sp.]|jgi:hypothetical protein|uniref:hypothetical protein n=1 Tax=Glutamicibacter sp. TaxID=1931995 RepID=UPI002FD9E2D3